MPPELMEPRIWGAVTVVFIAGVLRGFTGFGGAMMIMPVLSTVYPPAEAVAMMMSLSLLAGAQLIPRAFGATDWRQVLPLATAALLAVPVGGLVLMTVEPGIMRRVIGGGVLFFAVVLASGWRWRGGRGVAGAFTAGGLSGVINGATGAGGGPVVLYLLAGPDKAETNRANLISYLAILSAVTAANMAYHGVFNWIVLTRVGVLTLPFLAATWLGSHLFFRSTDAAYRRLAMVGLFGVGFYALLAP